MRGREIKAFLIELSFLSQEKASSGRVSTNKKRSEASFTGLATEF